MATAEQKAITSITKQLGRSTAEVSVDGTATKAVPLRDQLEALRYLKEQEAATLGTRPWKDFIAIPPGATSPFA